MRYRISLSPGRRQWWPLNTGELYKYWNDCKNPRSASYKLDKFKIQITLVANQLVSHNKRIIQPTNSIGIRIFLITILNPLLGRSSMRGGAKMAELDVQMS